MLESKNNRYWRYISTYAYKKTLPTIKRREDILTRFCTRKNNQPFAKQISIEEAPLNIWLKQDKLLMKI